MRKFFVICRIRGTTCQGLQKSAKADVLFIMLLVKQHYKIGICFCPCDEKKFIRKQPHSRLQHVIGFQPMRRKEIYSEATSFEVATCQGLQKSAKADVLFIMLLVKQHYKIGICFCPCDEKKFIQKQPHSRLQRVIGFKNRLKPIFCLECC